MDEPERPEISVHDALKSMVGNFEHQVRAMLEGLDDVVIPEDTLSFGPADLHTTYVHVLAQEQTLFGKKEQLLTLRLTVLDNFHQFNDAWHDRYDKALTESPIKDQMSWEERAASARIRSFDEQFIQRKAERMLKKVDDLIAIIEERLRLLERISFHLHRISTLMTSDRILRGGQ